MPFPGYRPYGATVADFLVDIKAVGAGGEDVFTPADDGLGGPASVTVWDAQTGGTQITDLLDSAGTGITEVTADVNGNLPRFHAPETYTAIWLDGGGTRVQAVLADLGTISTSQGSGTVKSINGETPDGAGEVTLTAADVGATPAGTQVNYTTADGGTVYKWPKVAGVWHPRPTSRSDLFFDWKGAAPAPPIDNTYALDGIDDWAEL